jgi:DNA repair protein RecO (recombination protein O)
MPSISDTAVCIRRWDFSETSQTVSLFTYKHGIVRGLAKGAKRPKGSFSGGLDVLTRGQVVAIVKPGRDLATLTEWRLEDGYRVLRQSLAANRAGLYMADLVHHLLTDHDPHQQLFEAFCAALDELAEPERIGAALLKLQWRLLEETGYRPELAHDADTGRPLPEGEAALTFSARAGGLVAAGEGPGCWRVRRETVQLLRRLAESRQMAEEDAPVVGRANRLLAAYGRELIGSEPPTMRWAFSDLGL